MTVPPSNTGTGASADGTETAPEADVNAYADMLATLDVAIDEARRKVESGRVYNVDHEKVRIKWIRALAYTVDIRRRVTVDRDLEALAEEVDAPQAGPRS